MSELKDYDIMDIEAMDDERLEKSESGKIQVTRVYIKSEADKVIAEKDAEIRRLERALWLARANRSLEKIAWFKLWNVSISTMNPEDGAKQEYDKWKKNLGKFLKKAEESR